MECIQYLTPTCEKGFFLYICPLPAKRQRCSSSVLEIQMGGFLDWSDILGYLVLHFSVHYSKMKRATLCCRKSLMANLLPTNSAKLMMPKSSVGSLVQSETLNGLIGPVK